MATQIALTTIPKKGANLAVFLFSRSPGSLHRTIKEKSTTGISTTIMISRRTGNLAEMKKDPSTSTISHVTALNTDQGSTCTLSNMRFRAAIPKMKLWEAVSVDGFQLPFC
jgi:hypothetical protein